jgi:hypothetical protein
MTEKLHQLHFNKYEVAGIVNDKLFEQYLEHQMEGIYSKAQEHIDGLHDFDYEQSDPEIYNLMNSQNSFQQEL